MKLYENFCENTGGVEKYNEIINICMQNHPEYIQKIENFCRLCLNQGNYKMEQAQKILFDEHNNLQKLNEVSYDELLTISEACHEYMAEQRMLWLEESFAVCEGNYPELVKILAKYKNFEQNLLSLLYQDGILSVKMVEYLAEQNIRQNVIWDFKVERFFTTIPLGVDLKKYQIIHAELRYLSTHSLFEYHLLVRNYNKEIPEDYIEEIVILFSDVIDRKLVEPNRIEKGQMMLRLVGDNSSSNIVNIKGDDFNQLLDICFFTATHFSFTKHRHHEPNEMYNEFLKELHPFRVKTMMTNCWFCYSVSLTAPFEIYLFIANDETRKIIEKYVDNLFLEYETVITEQATLLEDLCFFIENKLLLGTVSHEAICHVYPLTKEFGNQFMRLGVWEEDFLEEKVHLL